jgi:hypothetical protein
MSGNNGNGAANGVMASMHYGDHLGTVEGKSRQVAVVRDIPTPPKELPALSAEERGLWDRYIRYRSEWREHDFHRLYELVKVDMRIAKIYEKIDKEDEVVESDQGKLYMNPLYQVLSSLRSCRKDLWKFLKLDMQREDVIALRPITKPVEPPMSYREMVDAGMIAPIGIGGKDDELDLKDDDLLV